jgi:membrane fusion protein, multidrug efflux system
MAFRRRFLVFLRYLVLLVVVGAIAYGTLYVIGHREKITYQDPPPPVVITKPTIGAINRQIIFPGYIEANAIIPVVPLVSGTITEFPAKVGASVEENELLAVIDDRPYKQQLLQAQASALVAQTTFDRVEKLHTAKATTDQAYEQAKAQRDATLAQLELAKLQLGYARVVAPVAGTILSTTASVGDIAGNQVPIAILANLDHLVVRLAVPERYFDTLLANTDNLKALVFRQSADGNTNLQTTQAVIESIAPYVRPQSKTFEVVCRLVGDTASLRPGMQVSVALVYETLEQASVLRQSDRTRDQAVYIYDAGTSTARWTELVPLAEDESHFALPIGYEDTWFIVEGQHVVFDGQLVTVVGQRED